MKDLKVYVFFPIFLHVHVIREINDAKEMEF